MAGLMLGATVLRDAVPITAAQSTGTTTPAAVAPLREDGARLQNEQNTIDIVRTYEPGLVLVNTEQRTTTQDPYGMFFGGGGAQEQVQTGLGSGFFVNDNGDILTNAHVVTNESTGGPADRITVQLMNSDAKYDAQVLGVAPQYDLALLRAPKLPKGAIKPIPLANSDELAVGQKAVAMGAPFGFDFSVTEGIVSSTNRRIPIGITGGITQNAIQTDAAVNPGNSGGPLLDSRGRVIGINTQIISPAGAASGTGQSAGVGFAIPINVAKNLLPRLQAAKGGVVYAPRIGIAPALAVQDRSGQYVPVSFGLSALTESARQQLKLPGKGLLVGEVTPGLPAAAAGLRGGTRTQTIGGGRVLLGGDVITAANGQPVDSVEDLQAALVNGREGDQIRLKVVRDGQAREVTVTLTAASFVQEPAR